MTGLSHENLANILKSYALSNPSLSYCQGMNFMAGFLFLQMSDRPLKKKENMTEQEEMVFENIQ